MNYKNNTNTYKYGISEVIVSAFVFLVVFSICLYGIMVFVMVHRIASREKIERVISEQTVKLSILETEYLKLKNSIGEDGVEQYGLSKVSVKTYIKNPSLGLSSHIIE